MCVCAFLLLYLHCCTELFCTRKRNMCMLWTRQRNHNQSISVCVTQIMQEIHSFTFLSSNSRVERVFVSFSYSHLSQQCNVRLGYNGWPFWCWQWLFSRRLPCLVIPQHRLILFWHLLTTPTAQNVLLASIACCLVSTACISPTVQNLLANVAVQQDLEETIADNHVRVTLFCPTLCKILLLTIYSVCGGLADGRNRTPREKDHCDCPEGWEGINCNGKRYHLHKKGTMTLIGSIVCTMDSVCDPLVPTGNNGTCYRGGLTVFENHQMCNVTSKFPIQWSCTLSQHQHT